MLHTSGRSYHISSLGAESHPINWSRICTFFSIKGYIKPFTFTRCVAMTTEDSVVGHPNVAVISCFIICGLLNKMKCKRLIIMKFYNFLS